MGDVTLLAPVFIILADRAICRRGATGSTEMGSESGNLTTHTCSMVSPSPEHGDSRHAAPFSLHSARSDAPLVQRGNNRQAVFFSEDDRQVFLKWLGEAMAAEGCALHTYVLMTNHFHLMIIAGGANSIPHLMQSLGRRYVSHVNREYRRTGTLWEGRYESTILDSESYVLVCHRYVEPNPVRAGSGFPARRLSLVELPAQRPGDQDPPLREHRPTQLSAPPSPPAEPPIANCSAPV